MFNSIHLTSFVNSGGKMKGLFAVAILLLSFGFVFGQGFSVGANAGLNYDMMNPDVEGMDTWTGIGFGGGLVFDIDIMPTIGAEVDVQYAMYKYSSSIDEGGTTYDFSNTINNLVVPVLFKYTMAMPAVSPYFVLGPSLIYGMSGTYKVTGHGVDISEDVPDSLLETDFGIQVGVGADLGMVAPINISPYFRFQYNLTADDGDTPDNSESAYDLLFGVNFTYRIK